MGMKQGGELDQVLDLETIELDMFRGRTPDRGDREARSGQGRKRGHLISGRARIGKKNAVRKRSPKRGR